MIHIIYIHNHWILLIFAPRPSRPSPRRPVGSVGSAPEALDLGRSAGSAARCGAMWDELFMKFMNIMSLLEVFFAIP